MSHDEQSPPPGGPTDSQREQPAKPRRTRRWYQFGLGSLLILLTLAAVAAALWRSYLEPYRRQRATMALIERLGGRYQSEAADAWVQGLFGHDLQNVTLVDLGDCDNPADYLEQIVDLPLLSTLAVGGPAFTDEHLARLRHASRLRGLVLDGTSVTEAGLESLRDALPQIEIYLSQRRAITTLKTSRAAVVTLPSPSHVALRQLLGGQYFEEAKGVRAGFITTLRTDVADVDLAQLTRLTKLKSLDLVGAHVSDAGLAHLEGLTGLQWLDLSGTRVSDAGLVHLEGLTSLQLLILYGTQVSDAALADLRRALPKCNVYR